MFIFLNLLVSTTIFLKLEDADLYSLIISYSPHHYTTRDRSDNLPYFQRMLYLRDTSSSTFGSVSLLVCFGYCCCYWQEPSTAVVDKTVSSSAYMSAIKSLISSNSSQCSTTGVTKAMICSILCVGCCI